VEREEKDREQSEVPLFAWDRQIVDPRQTWEVAARVAACMRIQIGYAEARFVTPYVAHDLIEW
jgi:hypothetical protein